MRYITPYILQDIEKKMVFLGGPRQVGKTTLAKEILKTHYQQGEYFNWDADNDRRAIISQSWLEQSKLVVFDELHKYKRWKQWIKGVYDTKPSHQEYFVTGSARLDTYRKGGDSLLGRYHYWRLHPFTIDERPETISGQEAFERLLTLGGFPEPFTSGSIREAKRWRRERFDRILKEDIRDLAPIRELQLLFLLIDQLRDRVGSSIAIANLAEDLHIASKTVKSWIALIESMYIAFPVYPYHRNLARAIQKPIKVYFYDNADAVDRPGVRLENLVATTLLKRLHFLEDYFGETCQLHYLRDREGREIDFVTVINNEVVDLIEVKTNDTKISPALKYYRAKLNPKRTVQIVSTLQRPFDKDGIHVTNPLNFFNSPPWQIQ